METYYIVYLSNGKTSERINTIPDVGTWLETNVDDKVHHISIKQQKYDRNKEVKDVQRDMQKLEERMNKLQAKLIMLKQE